MPDSVNLSTIYSTPLPLLPPRPPRPPLSAPLLIIHDESNSASIAASILETERLGLPISTPMHPVFVDSRRCNYRDRPQNILLT
jgi:hypothetical protein